MNPGSRIVAVVVVAAISTASTSRIATVPFVWTPGQIEVAVRVKDTSARFLLDTGAEYSVVSRRLATELGLATERRGARDFASEVTLRIGDLVVRHDRVMVMPFDSYRQRGRAIDGLIGYELFARYVVGIDFAGGTIVFWEPATFVAPSGGTSLPIEFAGRLPVIRSTMTLTNGATLAPRLMVDTGASQAVILRYPFSLAHHLLELDGPASSAPSLADGVRTLKAVPVKTVTIGNWSFDAPLVRAFTEPIGSAAGTASDGLIGNALLSRFTLYVDYRQKRLILDSGSRIPD